MLNKKELKALIGQEIALIPMWNSVTRGVKLKDQIRVSVLESVGIKNIKINGSSYPMNGGCNKYNFGYIPFLNKQEALDYLEAKELTRDLKGSSWSHLKLEQVKAIQKIIGEDNE